MPHIQLTRKQYTALYRIARLNKYSFIPDYMKSGVERAYDKLTDIDLPIGCFYFVEASYRQRPIDWLAFREARYTEPAGYTHNEIFMSTHNARRMQP